MFIREIDSGDPGTFKSTHNLQIPMVERGLEGRQQPAPVECAQRLFASTRDRQHDIRGLEKMTDFDEIAQGSRRETRHVASHDQIPVVRGILQRCMEARQGTRSRKLVANHWHPKAAVSLGVTDDCNRAHGFANRIRHVLQQSLAVERQQCLVAAHARTAAAGQYVSRQIVVDPQHFAGMITLESNPLRPPQNTMLRNCLIIVVSMAALASPGRSDDRVVRSVVQTDVKTGKLIRKTVVSVPVSPEPAEHISQLIDAIAAKHDVEPPLVRSVIRAESNYNPLAVSNKGAQGLMQLIPSTAKRFGVKDSFDSEENIEGGVKYLKYLIALFHGDYAQAIAAYNAGEAAVAKYGGVPPYKETQNYVAAVSRHLAAERRTLTQAVSTATQALSGTVVADAAPVETYNPIVASVSPDGRISYKTP